MRQSYAELLVKLVLFAVVTIIASPKGVFAQDDIEARMKKFEDAIKTLQEQNKALQAQTQALQRELTALRAQQTKPATSAVVDEAQIKKVVDMALDERKPEAGTIPDWVQRISFSGDFRYRLESIDAETDRNDWAKGHYRNRIRARLAIKAIINNDLDVLFRLASGSADPASTTQTLSESFSTKGFWLDRAYFDWHPESIPGLKILGGKMKNPFYTPGNTELVWDGDINPEGAALQYAIPFGQTDTLYVNGGSFWVDENSGGVDTRLLAIQAYVKHQLPNKDYLLGGASYYDYSNIKGRGDLKSTWSSSGDFFGNSTDGTVFLNDYNTFEAFGEYGTTINGMPIAVFGDYVENTAASNENTGWLVGININKLKDPGSWRGRYNYRELEDDAVLGAITDSDFIGGGTNGSGHEFGFDYQFTENVIGGITYFLNERTDDETDYRRLQTDLIIKF